MPEVSVVLISKNQAWNIARLIESALRGGANISVKEIVLVDSASTDGTVAMASQYAVTILRLRPDQHLSPAAGRYVGYQHTTGAFVLFLDGDMELCPGWLDNALRVMDTHAEAAVVTGQVIDLPKATRREQTRPLPRPDSIAVLEIAASGGAALYRRAVLEQVGTFNPHLYSEEEPELCLRIRHAGYRIFQLEYPIAHHYSNPEGAFSTLVGRWKRNLYLGDGQVLRYHLGDAMLWTYLRERGYMCAPLLGGVIGLCVFVLAMLFDAWRWFGVWLLLPGALLLGDLYRKRSVYRMAFSLLHRLIIVDGTIRGFWLKPLAPEAYTGKLDVVKLIKTRRPLS